MIGLSSPGSIFLSLRDENRFEFWSILFSTSILKSLSKISPSCVGRYIMFAGIFMVTKSCQRPLAAPPGEHSAGELLSNFKMDLNSRYISQTWGSIPELVYLELDLIPGLIPGIGMGINFQGIAIELELLKSRWN